MIIQFIQACIQIVTESLPVSSSGHLLLLQKIYGWPALSRSFEYIMHGPTIILLVVYFRNIWYGLLCRCWRWRHVIVRMICFAFSADLITTLIYICMQYYGKNFPLSIGLCITAVLLFSLRYAPCPHQKFMPFASALMIGCMQGVAGLPGISRLASTYVAGIWLGLKPRASFYFSCMIQFPLLCAGFLYGIWLDADTKILCMQPFFVIIIIGAMLIAYLFLWLVQQAMEFKMLWKLGYYMLIPAFIACLI